MNRKANTKFVLLLASLALLSVLILSLTSAYPYSNYYGPSSDNYYKQTSSTSTESSSSYQNGDTYLNQNSRTSTQTTVERRTADDNNYYAYNSNRYYIQPGPSPSYISAYNDYYAQHFGDYQYPSYLNNNYNYNHRTFRTTLSYIGGDNPAQVGYEHYTTPYIYAPVSNGNYYDWHSSYYVN